MEMKSWKFIKKFINDVANKRFRLYNIMFINIKLLKGRDNYDKNI